MFIHTANIVRKPKNKTKNVHKKYKNYPPKFSINHCTKNTLLVQKITITALLLH